MEKYSSVVLRIGLIFVFAWFGINQITNPESWTRLIPEAIVNMSGLSAHTFVLINGAAEIIAAILLLLGIFTRLVAFLLFLHMLSIVSVLGLTAIGVRDVGIAFACLTLAFLGSPILALTGKKKVQTTPVVPPSQLQS